MHIGAEVDEHVACRPCLVRYLEGKLEEDDKLRVFPIICPVHEVSLNRSIGQARAKFGGRLLRSAPLKSTTRRLVESSAPTTSVNG